MTSQLRLNVQASQAVHGADDSMMTTHFYNQINSLSICDPKLIVYLLLKAGGPNLILLTLVKSQHPSKFLALL